MKNFNFQNELKNLIEKQKLVEIRFRELTGDFKVAYILNANSEFITLAEISDHGELDGVCMYHSDEICSFSYETFYLNKLEKKVNPSALKQALKDIEKVKDFSFVGLASAFEDTDTIVEVAYEADSKPAGKIIGHDENTLFLVELDDEFKGPQGFLAYTLINLSTVTRMSLDIPYMRDIATSLKK